MLKKLFMFLALISALAANNLKDRVDEFISLNQDIIKWSEELKSADEISKDKINQEIKACKSSKGAIITSFAALINDENLNKAFFKDLKSSKMANKTAAISFYDALYKLHEAFLNNASESKIKHILDAGLDELKASKLSGADVDTYSELLTYLRLNTNIFKTNFVLKNLDAKKLIDTINNFFPASLIDYVNMGKLLVCIIIFIVVYFGFRRLVLKLLALLLHFALKSDKDANEYFFNKLKRPVILLFLTYTLRLCVLIAFYPAPTAPLILKIFNVLNVLFITWMIVSAFNSYGLIFISKLASKSGRKDAINLIIKIANYIIIAIAILIALAFLGFDVSAIIASLGIGGLAVALAAKDIIANFFASVLLHFDNAFNQGDWVQINSAEGTVVEIGMRKTAIRTFDNSLVFVPNSSIMTSNVKNWSRRKLGRKIGLSIGLEYSCTSTQVAKIMADIRAMLKAHPGIAQPSVDNFKHSASHAHKYRQNMLSIDDLDGYKNTLFVYLDEFAASSINIYVYCFSKSIIWGEFLEVKEDVMLKIMQIIEANGASFAFPSTSLYLEETQALNKLSQRD